jgi:DNA polymerase V
MFALVDCNNFYVSCERVFQPQYNGKPVVVLSNNDGCVISRSEEAKDAGIKMGVPYFKIKEEIIKNNVKVFSSNYPLYGDLSARVNNILNQFSPDVEFYSIDESFLNFDRTNITDFHSCGADIKKCIQKWVSIPVCVGFGETKALSKIANRIAKKFKKETKGVHVIDNEEKRIKALRWTKIEDVWGIGFRLSKKMQARGIFTAHDFTLPENELFIKKTMGVVGVRLRHELLGIPMLKIDEELTEKKSICITRSFETTIYSFEELKERLITFASVASEKLRKQHSCCRGLVVYLRKDKHKIETKNYSLSVFKSLPYATSSSIVLANEAVSLLKNIYETGFPYSKAGVFLVDIIPENQVQYTLFENENPKHRKLMHVIDDIKLKTGERKLRFASQDLKKTWKMKQHFLSNRYTTNKNEIFEVKC